MRLFVISTLCFSSVLKASAQTEADARPTTVWLCGDSTMARGGGGSGTEGWGEYLHYSLGGSGGDASSGGAWSGDVAAPVVVDNSAVAGRSARSFTREDRFQRVLERAQPGDWAIVEFGHNDGGDPATDTKRRADCPGTGKETCLVTYDNHTEAVQTYTTYLLNATEAFLAAGVGVVLSSPTPTNPYERGDTFTWTPTRYAAYAREVARRAGGPARGAFFVDHGRYAAGALQHMDAAEARRGFPTDHTHTAPWLADVFARAFVLGLKCGTAPLQARVANATSRIEGGLLGSCAAVNSTDPV